MNEHKAVVVSLWDKSFHLDRPFGSYTIAARPDNGARIIDPNFLKSFSATVTLDAKERMDIGEKRGIPMREVARDIADDLVKSEEIAKFGVFVAAGDEPTEAELRTAQARMLAFYRYLIQDGDAKWARLETRKDITDLHRKAVNELGEKREWVYRYTETPELPQCPACGETQKTPDPAICWNCKYPMNKAKAVKLGIIEEAEPEPVGAVRGSGGRFTKKE